MHIIEFYQPMNHDKVQPHTVTYNPYVIYAYSVILPLQSSIFYRESYTSFNVICGIFFKSPNASLCI